LKKHERFSAQGLRAEFAELISMQSIRKKGRLMKRFCLILSMSCLCLLALQESPVCAEEPISESPTTGDEEPTDDSAWWDLSWLAGGYGEACQQAAGLWSWAWGW